MATTAQSVSGPDHAALIPLASHAGAPPILIKRPLTAIGSRKDAVRLHLESSTVSKVHCVIVLNDWGCYVHDMGSRTHTWVNGKQVVDADLNDGDTLQIGRFQFKYVAPANAGEKPPRHSDDTLDVSTLSDPLPLPKRVVQIGRRVGSDLQLDENKVSNIHAILFDCNGVRFVRDMGSRTGTWLDGKPVHQEPLYENAQIKVGSALLTYALDATPIDEIDLPPASATLTLEEAAPMPSIGLDGPLELDEQELVPDDEAVPDDLSESTEIAPVATDDALADLRRNWQAPSRAIEPPEIIDLPTTPSVSDTPAEDFEIEETPLPESKEAIPEELEQTPPLVADIASDAIIISPDIIASEENATADEAASEAPIELEPADAPEIDLSPIDIADELAAAITVEAAAEPTPEIVAPFADIADEPEIDLSDLAPLSLKSVKDEVGEAEIEPALDLAPVDKAPPVLEKPVEADAEPLALDLELADIGLDQIAAEKPISEPPTDSVSHVADTVHADINVDSGITETPEAPPAAETIPSPEEVLADLSLPANPDDVLDEAAIDALLAEEPITPLPEAITETEAEAPAESESIADELRPVTPTVIVQPAPEPEPEVDAVDLSVDLDQPYETPDDATALAVDFGLDELDTTDETDVEDAVSDGPQSPTEIDFSAPHLSLGGAAQDLNPASLDKGSLESVSPELDPLDLSNLESFAENEFTDESEEQSPERPLIDMADAVHDHASAIDAEDIFEAESVDVIDESPADASAPAVAAAGPLDVQPIAPEDDIPAPSGGSLSDLLPGGPALLGGAFTGDLHGPVVGGSPSFNFTNDAPAAEATPKRRGPLRVGFAGSQRPKTSSPFSKNAPTIGDVLMGRRGGASVDVFANPSPSAEELQLAGSIPESDPADDMGLPAASADELADVQLSPEQREILRTAEAFRARGPLPEPAPAIPPTASAADIAAQRARAHKKHVGWVGGGLVLMVLLIGGAVAAVYNYLPVYSTLDGLVTFNGLDRLGADDARQFRKNQDDNLQSESVREDAIQLLPKDVTFGFLTDARQTTAAIDSDPKTRWPTDQPTVMRLQYRSTDKVNDMARLRALTQALIDANQTDINREAELRKEVSADQLQDSSLQQKIDDVNAQLQILQQAGDQRPDPAKLAALAADRQNAEAALRTIRASRQELEATEQRLTKEPTTQESTTAVADVGAADQELAKLNAQLGDLQKQGELLAANTNDKSARARKSLDDTIADVQQSMQTAQKLRDNPDLVAYVDSASHLFTLTRQLTESLIQRQENMRTRLIELKSSLSDRVAARTADLLGKDDELKKLNDELAIGTRQYNAAVAQGYTDDAKKIELQDTLYKSLIAARTELLAKDPANSANSDAIDRIQQMIEQEEKSIDQDRTQINDTLAQEQDKFMQHAPAVDKLPAEQKALAEALEQKMDAVTAARQAYDSATESTQAEQAKIDAALKDKTTGVQLEIAARKHDLALAATQEQAQQVAAAKQKQLDETRTALADVRSKEQIAQAKLDGSIAAIEQADKLRREFIDSDADREAKLASKQQLESQLQDLNGKLSTRESELARLIVPESKFDLQTVDQPDRRLLFAGLAAAAVFLLMMIPIGWNLVQLWRDAHLAHRDASPFTLAQAPAADPNGAATHAAAFDPIMANVAAHNNEHQEHEAAHPSPLLATAHAHG